MPAGEPGRKVIVKLEKRKGRKRIGWNGEALQALLFLT
jgi:hypothetical protein